MNKKHKKSLIRPKLLKIFDTVEAGFTVRNGCNTRDEASNFGGRLKPEGKSFNLSRFISKPASSILCLLGVFYLSACEEEEKQFFGTEYCEADVVIQPSELGTIDLINNKRGDGERFGDRRGDFCVDDKLIITANPAEGFKFVSFRIRELYPENPRFISKTENPAEFVIEYDDIQYIEAVFEFIPIVLDNDGDGIFDGDDPDDDNDGVSDEDEIANGTDPNDPDDTPDLIPPVITLVGSSTLEFTLSEVASLSLDTAIEGYVTAVDNVDGDISSSITISTNLDITQTGTYEITYTVNDQAGNTASVSRTVILTEDIYIYFENGICKCPEAALGQTTIVDGITYTVVDDTTIANEIALGNVNLCTTAVTNMSGEDMINFFNDTDFNSDISFWDTSNVTDFSSMFKNATEFNQNIGGWDTSNVFDTHRMFLGATSFNQNISSWDVSMVTDMYGMFENAEAFNQPLGSWNVSNVTDMDYMFLNARAFNQDITSWCVSNFTSEPTDFSISSELTSENMPDWGSCPLAAESYTVNVVATSSSDYTLSGNDRNGAVSGNDPALHFNIGDTLNFVVNASGHPFYLKRVQGTGIDDLVSGAINNGATNDTVSWTPTATGTYYYQCSLHDGMYGTITISN